MTCFLVVDSDYLGCLPLLRVAYYMTSWFIVVYVYNEFMICLHLFTCSGHSSLCGTHSVLSSICHTSCDYDTHPDCLTTCHRHLYHLRRLNEQHGTLQLRGHPKMGVCRISSSQVSYVHALVSPFQLCKLQTNSSYFLFVEVGS